MSTIQISSSLDLLTCRCGIVYAVPTSLVTRACPACSGRTVAQLQSENSEKYLRIHHLERRVRSLRGHLARRKETK